MLVLNVEPIEFYNEQNMEFVTTGKHTLRMEHSLISVSKWESLWKIPFLSDDEKTNDQMRSYYELMCLDKVDPLVFSALTKSQYELINEYIVTSQTATWFSESQKKWVRQSAEMVTSELIYCWMTLLGIPKECEKWHLSRLLTLIRICSIKNQAPEKMKKSDILSRNAHLNKIRRNQFRTKG